MRSIGLMMVLVAGSWSARGAAAAQDKPAKDDEPRRAAARGDERPLRTSDAAKEPGYLGLTGEDRLDRGKGVRVIDLAPNGPAITAGVLVNDLIVAIDGQTVRQMDDMAAALRGSHAGSRVKFDVLRQGIPQSVEMELGTRPATAAPAGRGATRGSSVAPNASTADAAPRLTPTMPNSAVLGIRTMPVTESAKQQYNLMSDARGAIVTGVTIDSPADKARIPTGALITAVDDEPVNVPDDLGTLIRRAGPGKEVEIKYFSRGAETKKRVTLGSRLGSPTMAAAGGRPARPAETGRSGSLEGLESRIRELEARLDRIEAALDRKN